MLLDREHDYDCGALGRNGLPPPCSFNCADLARAAWKGIISEVYDFLRSTKKEQAT